MTVCLYSVLPLLLLNSHNSNEPFENMTFGLRSRRPMKRTTSMTMLGLDPSEDAGGKTQDARSPFFVQEGFDLRMLPETVSPMNPSGDFLAMEAVSTAQYFLGTCCLCKRRLIPGRDIYMYRGDSAFCSHECRQQQMKQDKRKEKCSLSASVQQIPSSADAATSRMNVTAEGERVAAI